MTLLEMLSLTTYFLLFNTRPGEMLSYLIIQLIRIQPEPTIYNPLPYQITCSVDKNESSICESKK